jgi:6-phosphogluconolactonase
MHKERRFRAAAKGSRAFEFFRWSFVAMTLACGSASGADWTAYVGTYTSGASKGIYRLRFDDATGKLTTLDLAAETPNPSFLAVSPNGRFLYAANEENAGSVSAFSNGNQKLTPLNTVSSRGAGPCHVALDKTGKWLFVANYNSGSVAAFPVHEDGTLGEASAFVQHSGSSVNPQRQAGPHAHSVNISPDNRFVLVADLGLDQILTYRIDAAKGLPPPQPLLAKLSPGSGPRHMAFGPDGRFVYVINEMLATVTVFQYDAAAGSLKEVQTISALPAGFKGANSSAEIAVHPSGKFLYASNRGHDSIAIFRIDVAAGTLTAAGHAPAGGKTPRNFAIDPSGKFLLAANQDSGNVVVFRIDPSTGALTPAGVEVSVPSPVSIVFTPTR